jgi:hypothetical protein
MTRHSGYGLDFGGDIKEWITNVCLNRTLSSQQSAKHHLTGLKRKKGALGAFLNILENLDYLFITYIVTSKPKRISVAAGVVHIIISKVLSV